MERLRISIKANGEDLPVIFKEDLNKYMNYLLVWIKDDYSPLEVKKENTIKLLSFMIDVMEASEERRGKTRINSLIKYCGDIKDERKFSEFYYNMILGSEGKSLLNGFGFSNPFGDNIKGNPERQSIYR